MTSLPQFAKPARWLVTDPTGLESCPVEVVTMTGRTGRTSAPHGHGHHGGDASLAIAFDQAFWDERYRSAPALWSGQPNPVLVAEVAGLDAGSALDIGCGEGADACWLALRGWQVTAVDVSTVALERGAGHARELGPDVERRINWRHADLREPPTVEESFDLVSAQFMHLPDAERRPLHRRLAGLVAPGGTLLVVGHHPSDLETTVPRPPVHELYFTASEVAAMLDPDGWTILIEEQRARTTPDPDGHPTTIHDAVLVARRRPS